MQNNNFFSSAIKLATLSILLTLSPCYAENELDSKGPEGLALHVWDRYVRRFRRDHNLNFSLGFAETRWEARKFGDHLGKNYKSEQASFVAEYTFHILLGGKTGYFLGTSTGYIYTRPENIDNEFRPSSSWLLPGVRSGLVYNYDPSGRLFAGVGAQLERFNELRTHRVSGAWDNASMTGESFQAFAGADLFFALNLALHFAWQETRTVLQKPIDPEGFLVDASLVKRTLGGEIGLLYHFL
jgi:hypothetical protein